MKVVGIVIDVDGKYFAKDKDGNVRRLKVGDKVYEGESVYGVSADDRIVLESPQTNDKLILFGLDEFQAGIFGSVTKETELAFQQQELQIQQTVKISSDSSLSQPTQIEAIGFQEVFLSRTGDVINVEASLLNTATEDDLITNDISDSNSIFNPVPELTTSMVTVEDNYYDNFEPSGVNSVTNTFSFQAKSGLSTLIIGDVTLSRDDLENFTPFSITMNAGIITFESYSKNQDIQTLTYTYETSGSYTHEVRSDLFIDSLNIKVVDIAGQEINGFIKVNVIDDGPTSEQDTNSIKEGTTTLEVIGNVFINDHIGADDSTILTPVIAVDGGVIGTNLYGQYGELLLNSDGTYTYTLDNSNIAVQALKDGESIVDSYRYTIMDGDGDTSTNSLNITIEGNTNTPVFYIVTGNVYESALDLYGTDGTSSSEFMSGYIEAMAGDGFNNVVFTSSLTSLTLTTADLNALSSGTNYTLQTAYGEIVFTNFTTRANPIDPGLIIGKLEYTYELKSNTDQNVSTTDEVKVTITDNNDAKVSDTLIVTIIDDKPVAFDNINSVTEDSSDIVQVSGNVYSDSDAIGLDEGGADQTTTPIVADTIKGQYGEVTFSSDGSYTYTLDNDNPLVNALNNGETLTDTLSYTLVDSDGSTDNADLIITINGFNDPELSVGDVTVVEDGVGGNLQVVFTITMNTTSTRDVTFEYATLDGSAKDGSDYTYVSGTATIVAGDTTATISVALLDDYSADDAESFDLKITNVNSAGVILDAVGSATINDDSSNDPYTIDNVESNHEGVTLKLIGLDSNYNEVGDNSTIEGQVAFYKVVLIAPDGVTRLTAATGTVDVVYTTGGSDTATKDVDYNSTVTNVTINTPFSIATIDDFFKENPNEFFTVALADNSSYSQKALYEHITHDISPVTTTIVDDTDAVILEISGPAKINESESATYTLSVNHIAEKDFTVEVALTNSTTSDGDFDFTTNPKTQSVTILAGDTSATFVIDTADDDVYEGKELYTLSITGYEADVYEAVNYGTSSVETKIIDTSDIPEISITDISIQEDGNAIFTVNISNAKTATEDIEFVFTTSDGSAVAGKDYAALTNGTGTILAGDTFTTIQIPLLDDYFADDSEVFNVTIAPATPLVTLGTATATATLNDNTNATTDEVDVDSVTLKIIAVDELGVALSDTTQNSMDEGFNAYYKVIMLDKNGLEVLDINGALASGTVDINYTDVSATAGIDYVDTLTTVTLNTTFSVTALNDAITDDAESFEITLVDGTYSSSSDYETVVYDPTKVTTTINEGSLTPVYLHITQDASVDEVDGAALTHTLEFKIADGTTVNLDSGKQVTVNLRYFSDTTEDADFQTKQTQVVITGDGGSSYTFSNIVADDFLAEGSESYKLAVNSVSDDSNFFEALLPFTLGIVTGTITDEVTPDEALVSIRSDQTIREGDISNSFFISVNQNASDVKSDIEVTLSYSGVALDGQDYVGKTKVIISAGSNYERFIIPTINDKEIEGSEDFTITIDSINDTNFESIGANPNASSVTNTIIDDVDANPDVNTLLEGGNQVTGNVLTNDELGVNAQVTSFTYKNEAGALQTGSVGIEADTQYGRLTLNIDGSYEYFSDHQENHPADGDTATAILPDIINYTTKDDNNDTSTSTLTLNVGDTIGSITDGPTTSVNEDDLPNGGDTSKETLIAHGDLGIAKGVDDVESVYFDVTEVQNALNGLRSHGVDLTYSFSTSNQVLTANAGATEVFVITLNQASGGSSYDFELKAQIDHLNSSGGKLDNLDIVVPFRYKEQGSTEDVVKGNLTVNVVDDTPFAHDDSSRSVVEGDFTPLTGNVIANDVEGADGAQLAYFKYTDTSGATQILWFSAADSFSVDTPTGALTISKNGDWSFVAHAYVDHDDAVQGDTYVGDGSDNDSTQGSFLYALKDYDTDISAEASQIIHVTDGTNPTVQGGGASVDEDDLASGSSPDIPSSIVNGSLNVTTGSDPIDVKFITTNSGTLSSDGVAINYTLSGDGYTLTAKAGSKEIFVATITDPTNLTDTGFSFELKGQIDHDNAAGENTKDIVLEFEGTDIDGDAVKGPLTITVTDDIPSIGTPTDGAVDESGLAYGSATDVSKTITTGSLAPLQEADSIDTIFTNATIAALESQNIEASLGNELTYALSNAGHTLTASFNGVAHFSVEIKDPTLTTASYEFTLLNAIYHTTSGGTKTINIPFNVVDFDGDSVGSDFDVVVTDDVGSSDKQLSVNEDGSVSFGVTADDIEPQADVTTTHGVISFNDATNLFTYTPTGDYSGVDNGIVLGYVVGGVSYSVNVNVTVRPISDAPTLSVDSGTIETDEDIAIALGLNAPIVKDNTDTNETDTSPNSTKGDNPERLGAIELHGIPSGAKILDVNGNELWSSKGGVLKIIIKDLDENGDGKIDHIFGVTGDISITKSEFETLKILPPEDSGDNFTVTTKVTSYEVNENAIVLTGVAGKESVTTVNVDVHAKTDDGVAITTLDATGDEDHWIRVDDKITITPTKDTDGSEVYEVVFDATSLPPGTLYYQGTPADLSDRTIGSDASGGFNITVTDPTNIPPIYIMTPINDSSDITNLQVTVNVHDRDSDSSPATDVVKSATDFINVDVTPLANDITVATSGASGNEDELIALNLVFDNQDTPLEKVTKVTIEGIPDGTKIYDASGKLVHGNSSGSIGSLEIKIKNGDLSEVEGYQILPPAHSSKDITLKVSMELKDFDDDGSSDTDVQITTPVDINVKVLAVTENDRSDSADPKGIDIALNTNHYYASYHAEEDTFFDLNRADPSFALFGSNEDSSEENFIIFTNLRGIDESFNVVSLDNAIIKYNDGSQDIEINFSATQEAKVPLAFLDTVQIKPPFDYAGTFEVDMILQSQDSDEDTGVKASIEDSHSVVLAINVNPVIDDNPNVNISQSIGDEDDGRMSIGLITDTTAQNGISINATISSLDSDGSEKFRVFLDEIPEDAALYYKGHIIYANSADDFKADGIEIIRYDNGTYKVQLEDYSSSITPKIIPPHNSDKDITLVVQSQTVDSAILADGTVVEVEGPLSILQDIVINIADIADQVVFTELRTFDVTADASASSQDKFSVDEKLDGSGVYNLVVKEDSYSSGIGANIELRDVFIDANGIDSYDNIFSNQLQNSPRSDASEASENVTVTLTNLAADFDVSGATLIGGIDSSRTWTFTLAELKAGDVVIRTPKHFSGEVDFDIKFISTENAGNSRENSAQDIKVLVTPVAEDLSSIPLESLDINEDVFESTYVGFAATLPDNNGNPESIHELWIKVDDVTGKEFKIFYDGNGDSVNDYNEVNASLVSSEADISIETIGADDYYHFQNDTFKNIYIQYKADIGDSLDTNIAIKTTFIDYIDIGGQIIANVSDRIDTTYSTNLFAVTDDIEALSIAIHDNNSDNDISDVTLDVNGDGFNNDMSVKVLTDTQIKVSIDIDGVDMSSEVNIDDSSYVIPNSIDDDGSEEIVSIRIDGVPKGIGVDGGYYAGDIEDPNNPGEYTGIWYIDNPTDISGQPMVIDADGVSYNFRLNIDGAIAYGDSGYDAHKVGGDITITFINKDGSAASVTDSVNLHLDDTAYNPSTTTKIPMDILEWNTDGKENVLVEDTSVKLSDLVNFEIDAAKVGDNAGKTFNGVAGIADGTAVSSNLFSITVEGLANCSVDGWREDSHGGTTFWTYHGSGGAAAITAALDTLILTPDQDYNENHDTAAGDSQSFFDEGPLTFTTTLTTYATDGFSDTVSLDYLGYVKPVTDDFDLNETLIFTDSDGSTTVEALEDGKVAITDIHISSVDSPYGTVVIAGLVTVTNKSVLNSAGESMDGKITYKDENGITVTSDLRVGESIQVTQENRNTLVFELYDFRDDGSGSERGKYLAGDVRLEFSAEVQEKGSDNPSIQKGLVDFYVNPVADGLDLGYGEIVGDEDTYIELTSDSGASFNNLGALVDPTETASSLVIEGVPNGYLIFYGDNHENAASVVGVSAGGLVSFNIPITGGTPPKVWLLPPENIGGVSSLPSPNWERVNTISIKIGVDDMGVTVFDTKPVRLTINAVADDVSIAPANASGVEGSDIALNFNATVIDTDFSERLIVTLQGLHQDAVFKLDGVEIDKGFVTYDKASDTYTIAHPTINYTNLSKLTFMQNDFVGSVTATVVAEELSNFDRFATPATATFNVSISQQDGTTGDDTLLFDRDKGNDGLSGSDTLVFGYDWAEESIDFTLYDDSLTKNIEVLDLTQHGDHNVNLSATDVEAMTDTNNALTINADSGDSVALANSTDDADDVWAQVGATNVYESAKGANITINGGLVGDALLSPTLGDDTLGYNDTKNIDGHTGSDRLIVFDTVEVDFTKVKNIEVIDFEVVGNHTVTNLSLSDVVAITDANESLTIFGDSADSVDFDAGDNWVKNDATNAYGGSTVTEGGKTFDVYTSANDLSVEVKVQVEVNDSI